MPDKSNRPEPPAKYNREYPHATLEKKPCSQPVSAPPPPKYPCETPTHLSVSSSDDGQLGLYLRTLRIARSLGSIFTGNLDLSKLFCFFLQGRFLGRSFGWHSGCKITRRSSAAKYPPPQAPRRRFQSQFPRPSAGGGVS